MARQASEYEAVVSTLLDLLVKGRTLDAGFASHQPSALAQQICYGVVREYFLLEAILGQLLDKPIASKHIDVRVLLLAGLYSLRDLNRPAYATVDRVVEAVAGRGKPWAKGLVNGVLRNYLRRREALERNAVTQRSAATNHPDWLYQRLQAAWPTEVDAIIEANNSHPPMTLRVNRQRSTAAEYARVLATHHIEASPGSISPDALVLERPIPVSDLPGFEDGLVSVQDEASQLAAPLMALSPGARVLDACAAPGGKTCHMLELEPGIDLVAVDIDAVRNRRIDENLQRLNLHCTVRTQDLLAMPSASESFDRILLDAPCSATGVIRRHPDIKLLRRDTDIDKLSATQMALLEKAWSLLGEQGILLYSTCSVLPEENDAVISKFVSNRGNVTSLSIEGPWGFATSSGRQVLPRTGGCDGFFYAKMRKMRSD